MEGPCECSIEPPGYISHGVKVILLYLGSVVTSGSYCKREIKMRIFIAKESINKKKSILTGKLNIELRKKEVRCNVWSITLNGSETGILRKLKQKYLESSEM